MDTTKYASVAVGIAFVIGLLYDFGYFVGLDLNFFTFLGYKDHLTVLVFFAAPSLAMALIFGGYRQKTPKLDWVAGSVAMLALFSWIERDGLMALPSWTAFFFWFRGLAALFLIPYLSAVIATFFSSRDWSKEPSGKQGLIGISIIGLILFIIMFGNFRGHVDVGGTQFEVEVTLAGDDKVPNPPRPAHLVRAIDDGMFLVLQEAPDRIVFVRKEGIKMLSKKVR